MSTAQTDRLRALLEPITEQRGVDLEDVTVTSVGRRRLLGVVVDADGGVDLDLVAELSREFSDALDAADAMGGAPYVLEVGSPGVERPLTEPKHWRRATGRLVKVRLTEGGELTARVLVADEDGAELLVPAAKGRGEPTRRRITWPEVARAQVQVELDRKAADREMAAYAPGAGGEAPDAEPADLDGLDDVDDLDGLEEDASTDDDDFDDVDDSDGTADGGADPAVGDRSPSARGDG
ncbi:ribosome maturation factor RimP [Allostreptomyces psammosilenae]|uniref:Ribosome maturation factor RimP n=1 Tax=Allostreptomyces psammosilenae TaxID=1892865 RepID=A0A853A4P2_9ACTN|nr:ribosome maturation factor RimP [Allostreptomyces psammosilenae]NYI08440.1 ribosome maturation factor RimP [Allostreptomyces psammosilenae]